MAKLHITKCLLVFIMLLIKQRFKLDQTPLKNTTMKKVPNNNKQNKTDHTNNLTLSFVLLLFEEL